MVTSYNRVMSTDGACVSLLCRVLTMKRKQNIIFDNQINNKNKKEPPKRVQEVTKESDVGEELLWTF